MSIATLSSDHDVSALSRLPVWSSSITMSSAATVGEQPIRWPFSSSEPRKKYKRSVPQKQVVVNAGGSVNQGRSVIEPSVDSPHAAIDTDGAAALSVSIAHQYRESADIYSQSLGTATQALAQGLTLRQKIVDIALVAMWGILIPAFMWLGAMAGF